MTVNRLPVPTGSISSSFPMSEAFYEQLTASFSSVPHTGHSHHRHPSPPAVDYPAQAHHEYPDGGTRHRVPSNASVHDSHGLVPSHSTPRVGEPHPHLNRDARAGNNAPEHGILDQQTMAMWSAAPIGFELDDWDTYLDTVNEMTQARTHTGGALA
ncbi:hypothetical protein FB451DRAFT_112968 [Mycena latifolia]|nr:hypothetical protein FB451DRAFT_112968 [Mycena latifolia]